MTQAGRSGVDVGDEPIVPIVGAGAGGGERAGEAEPPREVVLGPAAAVETSRVRRGRRVPLLAAVAVVVVGGLGAAALLGGGDDDPDPDETLAAAQAAVSEVTSFRLTMSSETRMRFGDDQNGTDTTTRFTSTGAWSGPRWQMRTGGEFAAFDTIVDGDTTYTRFAESDGTLDDALWQKYETEPQSRQEMLDELESVAEDGEGDELGIPEEAGFRDEMAIGIAETVYLGGVDGPLASAGGMIDSGFATDPGGFLDAVREMGDPTLVDEANGVTTLALTLEAPADVVEAFGSPLPEGKVELDVGADDLPTALRLDVVAGESSSSVEIELSAWNEPVEITIPTEDQVDATPNVDEEALRGLQDLALVWPTDLPEGWELTVYPPDETAEMEVTDGDCEAVELDWDDWESMSDEGEYFWAVERPVDCALAADPTPFEPGGPGGLPSRAGSNFGSVEVQVGETAVEVDSTLEGDELDAVIASLVPVDVETLIAAVPTDFEL